MENIMRVFISWSGERSRAMAAALRGWLESVMPAVKPFMSEEDIEKGSRGLAKIAAELEGVSFGIICITPENQDRPWLNFEAGAISKIQNCSLTWTLLLEIGASQITGPLNQFQHTKALDQEDFRRL